MEVGTLKIGGEIETSNIEKGLNRIDSGFKNVSSTGKGVNSDFIRMNQSVIGLGKKLAVLGLAGATAMVALAKGSPAVSGAMARMKAAATRLKITLGEALKPAFDMASNAFNSFVGWVDRHKEGINNFATITLGGLIDALHGIKKGWNWITDNFKDLSVKLGINIELGEIGNWLLKHYGPDVVGGLIGAGAGFVVGGPTGAAVGGGIGLGATFIGRRLNNPAMWQQEQSYMNFNLSNLYGLLPSFNLHKLINMAQAVFGENDNQ